ncbi:MAG: hypothetical protein QF927_06640, partial [Verrucomicrobiota bacterium]|nr:hypothetical protein [Verrucomicrobiota bacterium]
YRSWEVVPKAPLWSVIGSVPTSTNYTTTVLNDHCPHGEIIILPATNVAGYHFTDMQFERVNTLTNLLSDTNSLANPGGATPGQGGGLGAGGAAITNFVGVMEDEVWQSTNHAYLAYPITLQTNAMLLGGIDKITYYRMQNRSLVGSTSEVMVAYSPRMSDYKFPDLKKRPFTFSMPNSGPVALSGSIAYEMDYVIEGVRKTGTFIKFISQRPDITFSAMNAPPTVTSTNLASAAVVNNNAINGLQTTGLNGPGVIQASGNMVFTFNKIGIHWDVNPIFFRNEENQAPGWIWGHYDGSMSEPMVFPDSQTIRDLERQIYSGGE